MKNNKQAMARLLASIGLAAIVGLGVGHALRESRASISRAEAVAASRPPGGGVEAGETERRSPANQHAPGNLPAELAQNLALSSGVTRWLYWIEAIENAELADFPRLAQMANGDDRATRLLADRWIEIAPRHLFDTVMAAQTSRLNIPGERLMRQLLEKWPQEDPQALVAAVNEAGDAPVLKDYRWQIAGKIIEHDAELGIRLFADWHIETYIPRTEGIEKWAEQNPRHAAEFTLANPTGYPTERFLEAIGKVWARTDPQGALEFATAKTAKLNHLLARSALKSWAESDLEAAGIWLAQAEPATRDNLSEAFVESWAKVDPASALFWCEQNLKGDGLIDSASAVLKGAAEKNVRDAAKLVAAMEPSAARAYAAAAVGEKWFSSSQAERQTADPDAVQWLAGLDSRSRARVLAGAQWEWTRTDPKGLADFLVSINDPAIPFSAFHAVARAMARQNPGEAMAWAHQLPTSTSMEAGNQIFQEWRRSQPDLAMGWFRELPADDSRRSPFFHLLMREMFHDPHAPAFLSKLNQSERDAAQRLLQSFQIPADRKETLLNALRSAADSL